MSTKTSLIKRVAALTVAVLAGAGLTAVTTTSASATDLSITFGTLSANAGITGQTSAITVPVSVAAGAAATDTVTVSAVLVAKPTSSARALNNTGVLTGVASSDHNVTTIAGQTVTFTSSASNNAVANSINGAVTKAWSFTNSFTFAPDVAGVYTVAIFTDGGNGTSASGLIKSGDTVRYISVTVADSSATQTKLTVPMSGTFAVAGAAGAVVRINAADALGNATRLNSGQQILVSVPTGLTLVRKVGASGSTLSFTGAEYGLVASDFDAAGNAYLNFTAASAGTYPVSSKLAGGTDSASSASLVFESPTALATVGGTFTEADATTTASPVGTIAGSTMSNASTAAVSSATTSLTYRVYAAAADKGKKVQVLVEDTGRRLLSPFVTMSTDLIDTLDDAVGTSTTNGSLDIATGTLSIPVTLGLNSVTGLGRAITISAKHASSQPTNSSTLALTVTSTAATTASGGTLARISPTSATITMAAGSKVTTLVQCKNSFGVAAANVVLTPTITGRNSALVLGSLVTDASGYATFSYTDASTSTTSLTDAISFGSNCTTSSTLLTVNFTSVANLGVAKLAWTAGGGFNDADYYAGYATTRISAGDDPSTNARKTLTFKATDASGNPVGGVPVTFSLSGLASAAIVKSATVDYTTAYTAADGTVLATVFAWAPGKLTVTATAGTSSTTGYFTFVASNTASDARVLSATANGNIISLKVVDRFGNGVENVTINLSRTGTGYFGTGASTATAVTDANGTVDVAFNGNGSVKAMLGDSYTQAYDAAGKISATAVTAAVAGTTTGTGASFAPAGVYTVSVDVSDTSSSAVDAANEATDAANAATDAANAAAEAADAATAAAQDAQAAVAALATQVASLIAGIKAQITTLTNLVIKIQKKVRA